MKITFPHTIINDIGEKLTFTGITEKEGVKYLEGFNEVQPTVGPPMHVHYKEDEGFTVISGYMGYQMLGQEKKYAKAGESVLFKAGVPHTFWNAGNDLLKYEGYVTNPGNLVYFLSEVYKSCNTNGGKPGLYDGAFLLNRYKAEYAMVDIPAFVQKIIFPVVLFFGNLMGKNKRFADAP